MNTYRSVVKWFDAKKGFGFIHPIQPGPDIFVHYTQIQSDDKFKVLQAGRPVVFELEDGPKGIHALNVQVIEEAAEQRKPTRIWRAA